MDKKLLRIIIAIATFIVGSTAFLLMRGNNNPKPSSQTASNISASETSETNEETTPATPESPGQYVDYDEAAIATAEGTKVIFFYAPWCPQCRALEADILDKGVPAGVTIFKTDYDTNQDLRQKYGVTIQTTLVKVDEKGNLIDKFVAYDDPALESVKQNLLR